MKSEGGIFYSGLKWLMLDGAIFQLHFSMLLFIFLYPNQIYNYQRLPTFKKPGILNSLPKQACCILLEVHYLKLSNNIRHALFGKNYLTYGWL